MVNMKLAFFAVLAAAATFVAADDELTNNGTTPSGNGTILDDGSGGNGTATNGTATNGTATNGTATNDTEPAAPSGGSTRRSLKICEYGCPENDLAFQPLALFTEGGDTFTCTFASGASCTYQTASGVLSIDSENGQCRGAALPLVAGCTAGQTTNGGVEKRKRNGRRSSRQIQYDSLAKRLGF